MSRPSRVVSELGRCFSQLRWQIALFTLLAAIIRLATWRAGPQLPLTRDGHQLLRVIEGLRSGVLIDEFFCAPPPGFALVATVLSLPAGGAAGGTWWLAGLSGIVLVAITCWAGFRFGPRVGFLSGLLAVVDLSLVNYSTVVSNVPFGASCFLASLLLWADRGQPLTIRRALLAGGLTGLTLLIRLELVLVYSVALPLLLIPFRVTRAHLAGLGMCLLFYGGYQSGLKLRTGVWGIEEPNRGWTLITDATDDPSQRDRVQHRLSDPQTIYYDAFRQDRPGNQLPGLLATLRDQPETRQVVWDRLFAPSGTLRYPQRYYVINSYAPWASLLLLLAAAAGGLMSLPRARENREPFVYLCLAVFPIAFYPFVLPATRYFALYHPFVHVLAAIGVSRLVTQVERIQLAPRRRLARLAILSLALLITWTFVRAHRGLLARKATLQRVHQSAPYREAASELLARLGSQRILGLDYLLPYYAQGHHFSTPYADLPEIVEYARRNAIGVLVYGPEERARRPGMRLLDNPQQAAELPTVTHFGTYGEGASRIVVYRLPPSQE